jgi:hypothetical protein
MIDSVERIVVVNSQDLPTHFRMMIGMNTLSFTRHPYSDYTNRVYFHHDGSDEEIYFQHNEPVAILVEDSLDNPVTYAEVMLELL